MRGFIGSTSKEAEFTINPKLLEDGPVLFELPLSKVIFVNNSYFPWVILVPRRNNVREFIDLDAEDRIQVMNEICLMSELMKKIFQPHKLNVAYLGNMVSQLHIHIVARREDDICWPAPVFGKDKKPYDDGELAHILEVLRSD